MEDKIKEILTRVFELSPGIITEDSNIDTIENWNSLNHVKLIVAIEEEFNISFDVDQILEMNNFLSVCLIVKGIIADR